jgi:hypothetical protein
MESVNIFDAEFQGRLDVAGALGSTGYEMFVYDVPPGASSSPYHYEFEEEWLLVVEGEVVVRAPDGEHTLRRGELVCFAAGPTGRTRWRTAAIHRRERSCFLARARLRSRSTPTATRSASGPATGTATWSSSAAPRCLGRRLRTARRLRHED